MAHPRDINDTGRACCGLVWIFWYWHNNFHYLGYRTVCIFYRGFLSRLSEKLLLGQIINILYYLYIVLWLYFVLLLNRVIINLIWEHLMCTNTIINYLPLVTTSQNICNLHLLIILCFHNSNESSKYIYLFTKFSKFQLSYYSYLSLHNVFLLPQ